MVMSVKSQNISGSCVRRCDLRSHHYRDQWKVQYEYRSRVGGSEIQWQHIPQRGSQNNKKRQYYSTTQLTTHLAKQSLSWWLDFNYQTGTIGSTSRLLISTAMADAHRIAWLPAKMDKELQIMIISISDSVQKTLKKKWLGCFQMSRFAWPIVQTPWSQPGWWLPSNQ